MAFMPAIDLRLVGPPPDRHAARVIGEMVKWLAGERVKLENEMVAAVKRSKSGFGSPRAQQRLVERLRKAGGRAILDLRLRPGKRGRFMISLVEWNVYDPATSEGIFADDPLPERPWLACSAIVVSFKRPPERFNFRVFLLTHHAMQRLAQRCAARTPFDLLDAMQELWDAIARTIDWERAVTGVLNGEDAIPMRTPKCCPVAGGNATFAWDEQRGTLVVTTVLDAEMAV